MLLVTIVSQLVLGNEVLFTCTVETSFFVFAGEGALHNDVISLRSKTFIGNYAFNISGS